MPTPAVSPISLSSAHIYTLERDPNKSPPIRLNHLPISSQTSPSFSSSPMKRPSSSANEVELNITEIDYQDEDGEDEFEGLEMIGNTQWEKEVPNFHKHKSKKQKISSSSSGTNEVSEKENNRDWNDQDEIDELDESDWELPFDLIKSQEKDEDHNEVINQVAMYSPIAGPSSPPMQTPAFSLPSLNSDIPSGPYPQTPQIHNDPNHQIRTTDHSTPISWSPSPLSAKDKQENMKRSLMILSDDSDEEEVDQENRPITFPSLGRNTNKYNSPPLSISRRGKSKRIINSDEEEEEEESLAVQKRRREKGKQKENFPGQDDVIEEPIDLDLTPKHNQNKVNVTLDNLFDDDSNENDENYDPGYIPDEIIQEEEEEFDFDDYGDFPFDQIDLDISSRNASEVVSKLKRTRSKSKSKSPQKKKTITGFSLMNDLFPPNEENQPSNFNSYNDGSILNKVDKPKGMNAEWDIFLISDLDEKWQDFYKNHWRRGVDKLNEADKVKRKNTRIGAILSEDDEEEERDIRPAKKTTVKRAGAGGWGWRGRGRAAFRGRGGMRGRGASKARRK